MSSSTVMRSLSGRLRLLEVESRPPPVEDAVHDLVHLRLHAVPEVLGGEARPSPRAPCPDAFPREMALIEASYSSTVILPSRIRISPSRSLGRLLEAKTTRPSFRYSALRAPPETRDKMPVASAGRRCWRMSGSGQLGELRPSGLPAPRTARDAWAGSPPSVVGVDGRVYGTAARPERIAGAQYSFRRLIPV